MRKIHSFGVPAGTPAYYKQWRALKRASINERARKRYAANPEKHRARAAEYRKTETYERLRKRKYAEHKASGKAHAWSRRHRLMKDFGITPDDYNAMLANQGGGCAICKSPSPKVGTFRYLCIDHCHKTNKVRGILCNSCNTAIGHFSDNPEVLTAAIRYLSSTT